MSMVAIAVALGVAAASAAAWAQPAEPAASQSVEVNRRTVQTADLDLSSLGGARRLALRIRLAAIDVCGGDNALARISPAFHDCVRDAGARAGANLLAPIATAELVGSPALPDRARH
jgi:UrcA family protein